MSITTADGTRYDNEDSFLTHQPSEHIDVAMNDNGPPIKMDLPISGLEKPPKPANDNDPRTPLQKSWIGDLLFGPPPPKEITGDPKNEYPTQEDVDLAEKSDNAYGKTYEPYVKDQVARVLGWSDKKGLFNPESAIGMDFEKLLSEDTFKNNPVRNASTGGWFAKAALAIARDPIATLGFDPSNTLVDVRSGSKTNIGGLTDINTGHMYVNEGSAIVHESIHNGLGKLAKRNPEAYNDIRQRTGLSDENIVRYIMHTVMGNPEQGEGTTGDKQIKDAKWLFEESTLADTHKKVLKKLQDLAADEIAKKHPGGPR